MPNNNILTQNLYYYYYPIPKYLISGHLGPEGKGGFTRWFLRGSGEINMGRISGLRVWRRGNANVFAAWVFPISYFQISCCILVLFTSNRPLHDTDD